jgi:hypothetical protein
MPENRFGAYEINIAICNGSIIEYRYENSRAINIIRLEATSTTSLIHFRWLSAMLEYWVDLGIGAMCQSVSVEMTCFESFMFLIP